MRELWLILKDVRAGVLPFTQLPSILYWRFFQAISQAFL